MHDGGDGGWTAALDAFLRGFTDASRIAPGMQYRQLAHLLGVYCVRYEEWRAGEDGVGAALSALLHDLRLRLDALLRLAEAGVAAGPGGGEWRLGIARMPGLGPTREWQRHVRELASHGARQAEAAHALYIEQLKIARAALDALQAALADESAPPITTARALYDVMVDCAEQAYRERVMSEDYARVFGAFVNAAMAVRREGLALARRWLTQHQVPTHVDIERLSRRLPAAPATDQTAAGEVARLARRVEDLTRELAELRARPGAAGPAARPARGKAPDRRSAPATRKSRAAAKTGNPAPDFDIGALTSPRKH